jgi:putative spermidine/putrescine transport system substrate-binding protein
MKKIAFNLLVLLVLASFVLSACGGAAKPAATAAPVVTEAPVAATEAPTSAPVATQAATSGEGEVNIVAWTGYIERGESDPTVDWVTGFEKATGCKVNVTIAGTSDEMVTLMTSGGYDLVTASGDASLRLIMGGTVQEIDVTKIPSWNKVDARLQNGNWHTVGGKHYGVPYQWGPNVLMYNTDVFPEAPKSWDVVFKEQNLPDGKSNKGRVEAYAGPIYIADAALYLKYNNPELGIVDPYELNEAQFTAALDLLRQQRGLVAKYWSDASQTDDFKNEGVVASTSWPYQVNLLQADKFPVSSTIPQEGATGWADTTMMSATAPHPQCAYLWLEHSIDPKVQGDVAYWFGSAPSVPDACNGASELFGTEGCKANGFDTFDSIHFWKTPIADCGNGKTDCVTYDRWTQEYITILGQ